VQFTETVGVGADTVTTSFKSNSTASWGSKQQEGTGSADYKFGESHLKIGQSAKGQVGGDPSALLLGIVNTAVGGLVQSNQAEPAQQGPTPAEMMQMIVELRETIMMLRAERSEHPKLAAGSLFVIDFC
jgi:hypothetical protein